MCKKCKGLGWIDYESNSRQYVRKCDCQTIRLVEMFLDNRNIDEQMKRNIKNDFGDMVDERGNKLDGYIQKFIERETKILLICGTFGRAKTTMLLKMAVEFVRRGRRIYYQDAKSFFNIMAQSQNIREFYDEQCDIWEKVFSDKCHHVFIDDIGSHEKNKTDSDTLKALLKGRNRVTLTSNYFLFEENGKKEKRAKETLLESIFEPGCIDIFLGGQCDVYETEGPSFR